MQLVEYYFYSQTLNKELKNVCFSIFCCPVSFTQFSLHNFWKKKKYFQLENFLLGVWDSPYCHFLYFSGFLLYKTN